MKPHFYFLYYIETYNKEMNYFINIFNKIYKRLSFKHYVKSEKITPDLQSCNDLECSTTNTCPDKLSFDSNSSIKSNRNSFQKLRTFVSYKYESFLNLTRNPFHDV